MSLRWATVIGAAGVLLGGALLWARWGALVWLDASVGICL